MGRRGVTMTLRYIQRFKDRHGVVRHYFRKPGVTRTALPGEPGSVEFMEAYQKALGAGPAAVKSKEPFGQDGSFHKLAAAYLSDVDFLRNKPSSQTIVRGILNRFTDKHGHRQVAEMERKHVKAIISAMADTPGAANSLLRTLKSVLNFAVERGDIASNPIALMKGFKGGTHHTWTDSELAQFEAHWPLGTRQRTTYALALYTGQRRSDVAHMSWRDIDQAANTIRVVQDKTGTELNISLHRELKAALDQWPQKHIAILANDGGRGTSVQGIGNFMATAIEEAGLPERCVLHGLRKAAARRLAEVGCSAHEIMSITGHKSLAEVQRYCDQASQKTRSRAAITRLERNERASSKSNHPREVDK